MGDVFFEVGVDTYSACVLILIRKRAPQDAVAIVRRRRKPSPAQCESMCMEQQRRDNYNESASFSISPHET